jgi:hypothetical protein
MNFIVCSTDWVPGSSVVIRNTNAAILRGSRKIWEDNLQFAFPVLQFATRTAIDCKLRSSNCKVQIEHAVAAGPRWVSSVFHPWLPLNYSRLR